MSKLNAPLIDTELDFFDDFLLNRIDDEADTYGQNDGVLDVLEVDGLISTIVSSPVTILPSPLATK